MQNTTRPPVVVLESISPEFLFQVNGGCGKKCAPPPAPAPAAAAAPVMQVLQMPALPQPQPLQQALPQALPPEPSGPEVSTSVSINGQVQG
jgi:hypothetical protein